MLRADSRLKPPGTVQLRVPIQCPDNSVILATPLDVGNDKSGSNVAVVVWLKRCFGDLVIFDCCFVMMEPLQL